MRHLLVALLLIALVIFPWVSFNYPGAWSNAYRNFHALTLTIADFMGEQLAAVFLTHKPKSVSEIQEKYRAASVLSEKKVKVLLVPGHEPRYGGAEFGNLKERELTVLLAQNLKKFLEQNGHYQVFVTRNSQSWMPEFDSYFKNNWNDILAWIRASRTEHTSELLSLPQKKKTTPTVYHNTAPEDVAIRLYGVTRWANEHDIDIVIHIHFNDYPGHRAAVEGEYTGFAIYVPTNQYLNSPATHAIADKVFHRLAKYNPVSNLPGESTGIVDEPELIAVGANNTADSASMLIEYGYLYEPHIANIATQSLALQDLAFQTYLGLQDFFGSGNDVNLAYDTLMLPRSFDRQITEKNYQPEEIFALQTAFVIDGVYPPKNRDRNDCPRSGKFGACTRAALESFQKKYGITGEPGIVGPKTMKKLNDEYGLRAI